MTLYDSILSLAEEHFDEHNGWYEWKKINTKYLPSGIALQGKNQYEQNVNLKKHLNQDWLATDKEQRKIELTHYYIHHWGGVRGNKYEKIRLYSLKSPDELIALDTDGVASWSKALCIRNPEKYAIFDARVAITLNLLQTNDGISQRRLFPILPSQNKSVSQTNKLIEAQAKREDWKEVPHNEFYKEYLDLLNQIAQSKEVELYTVEMLLFSQAPKLYEQYLGRQKINNLVNT